MYVTQSIQRPHGINVFGSSLIRVDPDYSSLRFAVSRVAAKPKDAFDETRRGADAVRAALMALKIDARDVRSGDLALAEEWVGYNENRRMAGYRATASFHAFVREFAKVEPVLVAVVDAGADRIHSVHHKTTRMREIRAEARKRAVEAAKAKAESYASAAGVKVGAPLHVEDVKPGRSLAAQSHAGRRSHRGRNGSRAVEPRIDRRRRRGDGVLRDQRLMPAHLWARQTAR
ncbi:MAG TPA: SIMPL domain-containing protein [Polyangiaceae bacterium]|nr:SIMPL domain-containing protein [Polyangiaceae bacterium]